jgi:hypothetical protein
MKTLAYLGAIAALGISAAAGSASPGPELLVPISRMVDGFNKGDMKMAASSASPAGMVIIDDVPPHFWSGADAFQRWSDAHDIADKKDGITDDVETNGKPTRVVVNADHGYVVMPALYTFKQKGVAMREAAQIIYTLQKEANGWLITGFAWVGTKPKPMTDAPK